LLTIFSIILCIISFHFYYYYLYFLLDDSTVSSGGGGGGGGSGCSIGSSCSSNGNKISRYWPGRPFGLQEVEGSEIICPTHWPHLYPLGDIS